MKKREILDLYAKGLKKCPMCGAKAAKDAAEAWAGGVFVREYHNPPMWDGLFPGSVTYTAICGCCGLQITAGTLEAVKTAWNRRVKRGKPTYRQEREREMWEALERMEAENRHCAGEI